MPDEEMEMAVDFGQAGFGEDIDIDLDFPTGQPDDDMDLEDFDRLHDIQNSDTRDELMAEGDDLSYGMVDAIELDHNISAAAANDIDIELGNAVESIWQQDSASTVFNGDAEIEYLDEITGENTDNGRNDIQTTAWLRPAKDSLGTESMVHATDVPVDILPSMLETQRDFRLEDSLVSRRESSGPSKTSQNDAETTFPPAAINLEDSTQLSDIEVSLEDEILETEAQIGTEEPSTIKQSEHEAGQQGADAHVHSPSPDSKLHESYEVQHAGHPNEVAGPEHLHVDASHASHQSDRLENLESVEPTNLNEDLPDPPQPEEADEPADGFDASEYRLGGQSYTETANDQTDADDNDASQAEVAEIRSPYSQQTESSPDRDVQVCNKEVTTAPDVEARAVESGDKDDPIELADHYGVFITYGSTDYSLFAKYEDDDPNQYFLDDKSTLDLSLAQFLTSLREVISDEMSPLDELVMTVDGLGLEFSESTTSDFLEKFTFGDLVVLYDKLVRNEQAESSPPLYTYLTVKPNCNQRMRALGESANAGRGLSEVAIYRDSSPRDEEQAGGVGSPNTDFSVDNDYNDNEGQIDQQETHEEGHIMNHGGERNSPPVTGERRSEHFTDQDEEDGGLDNDDGDFVDDSAVALNHEQDVSISKQGIYPFIFHYTIPCTQDDNCWCDDCYEVALQHIGTPMRGQVWPTPSIVMPTHNTPAHMIWMTNRTTTEDHAASESSVLQQHEASEHGQRPSPKTAENGESKPQAPRTSVNSSTDAPNSENTSVTATLDGEDQDEIDYNSDEDDAGSHDDTDGANLQEQPSTETDLKVPAQVSPHAAGPADDEITWESESEEAKTETKGASPRDAVQVSPVSGKRTRSDSDDLDGAGGENDNKRRRSRSPVALS